MKNLLYIFYVESAISLLSAFQALFMPAVFLQQLTTETAPTLAIEMTRWYGVVLFVLVYLLLQGLRMRGPALKLALQAMLFGDVLQIGATFVTAKALGGWSFTLIMSVVLSAFYLIVRAFCLWKPAETGVDR
ncbi:MAG: hypothetical protein U0V02_15680 [Anaerolineales bacterium]